MSTRQFILREERIRENCLRVIGALNLDLPWAVVIRPYKKDRSLAQNRLYWDWLTLIGTETGYDKDDLHEALAEKFLPPVPVRAVLGEIIHRRRSTTTLSVAEFTAYLVTIERFAASDLGIQLPRPEDMYHEAMGRAR